MLRKFVVALLVTAAAWASPIDGFPPDPAGSVRDRLFEEVKCKGSDYNLYAVMTNDRGKVSVTVYKGANQARGMEWKKLYVWQIPDGISTQATMRVSGGDQEIQFFLQESFAYVEGRAVAVLHYDPSTGKFEPQLAD